MTELTHRSPFLVTQGFLTPAACARVAEAVRVAPTLDNEERPMPLERHHLPSEELLFAAFKPLIPELEARYAGFKYLGTEHLVFQQFPARNELAERPHCESAVYKRKRWVKVRDRDLTGILWLKDYQDAPPFDLRAHVLGGKLEFPAYSFGLQPQRGTLVVYPACERFISLTTPVLVGELQCVRFHVCGENGWTYDPAEYPGDFRTWFRDII